MDLLLAEQTLLLALDDVKGNDTVVWAGEGGLAAALLLDLARRELLRVDDDKTLRALDGEAPGHRVLADAHRVITGSAKRRTPKGWVDRLPQELKPLRERLARGLVAQGVLTEESSKVMGLFSRTRFPTADPGPEEQLRGRLTEVLLDGRAPTEEEALLVGLMLPLGLVDRVVPKSERGIAARRAAQVAEQGVAGGAVQQAVKDLQLAVLVGGVLVPAAGAGGSS